MADKKNTASEAGKAPQQEQAAQEQAQQDAQAATHVKQEKQPDPEFRDVVRVRAVAGRMVDPIKNREIGQEPVEIAGEIKEGSWLDCQIKAGKIERI